MNWLYITYILIARSSLLLLLLHIDPRGEICPKFCLLGCALLSRCIQLKDKAHIKIARLNQLKDKAHIKIVGSHRGVDASPLSIMLDPFKQRQLRMKKKKKKTIKR
jgi:hypothetical protein